MRMDRVIGIALIVAAYLVVAGAANARPCADEEGIEWQLPKSGGEGTRGG